MTLQNANLTSSIDKPEGLMDALMQVAVCEVCKDVDYKWDSLIAQVIIHYTLHTVIHNILHH